MPEITMEELKLKFDGQPSQITANTLINSLIHFTHIVEEVNKDLQTGGKVEIKINALPAGSFICHIEVQSIVDAANAIFTKENIAVAKEIVQVVTGIYKVAKFLKGKKPKEVESTSNGMSVTNESGNVTIFNNSVVNIYTNNRTVQEALSQEFETLDNDPNVTGFELLDENDSPIVEIQKSEFDAISATDGIPLDKNERIDEKEVHLNIVKLSFNANMKWEFLFLGNKISAKIEDEEFLKKIDAGESFAKGDSLKARIQIRQEFDEGVNAFVNKGYKVVKIIEHIPRGKQRGLFDKD